FHSTYRLINGKAFPSTPAISTAAGNKVLVRYLNAGLESHSMGPLGLRQNVVAIDAQPSSTGALVADTLPPGETEDAILTAVDGQTPIYDAGGSLDNAGALVAGDRTPTNAAGLNRVAFGGLVEMLTTTPTTPTSDTAGPKVTVTSSSSTSVGFSATDLASAWCASGSTCGPGTVTRAEYVIDTDPSTVAAGTATGVTLSSTTSLTATGTITLPTTLGNGQHRVYIRAMDDSNNWGAPTSTVVTVLTTGPSTTAVTVTPNPLSTAAGAVKLAVSATGDGSVNGGGVSAMEYWVVAPGGGVPAAGSGTAMTMTAGSVVSGTAAPSVGPNAAPGTWTVYVDSKGANGVWGAQASATFVVDNTGPNSGVSNGTVTPSPTDGQTGDPVDPTALKVQATFTDTGTVTTPVVAAEGFFDPHVYPANTTPTAPDASTAPTITTGKGFVFVANDGVFDGTSATTGGSEPAYGLLPLSQLTALSADGTYWVWVHGKDKAGNWGTLSPIKYVVTRTPALTGTFVQNSLTSYGFTVTGTSAAALTSVRYSTTAPTATTTGTACTTGTFGPGAVSVPCGNITVPTPGASGVTVWVRGTNKYGTSAWIPVNLPNQLVAPGSVTVATTQAATTSTFPAPAAASVYAGFTLPSGTGLTTGGSTSTAYVTVLALRGSAFGNLAAVQYQRKTSS
ncbi:MAG: hypothetical protein JO152_16495, partial [Mycobacteriaceae bacterium]|nr:hypothetical protein [Mycobacteriaceae bacterium]